MLSPAHRAAPCAATAPATPESRSPPLGAGTPRPKQLTRSRAVALSLLLRGRSRMSTLSSVDVAGRQRSPATFSEFHRGRTPRNKGMRYPADPPRVEEIVAVMRQAGDGLGGDRVRALIVVLWRAGLRIQEALDLYERDLDPRRGALLVRSGKGGKRREVGMDDWGWEHLGAWARRLELPTGPLFCIISGPTRGRPWPQTGVRRELRRLAAQAGVRRR